MEGDKLNIDKYSSIIGQDERYMLDNALKSHREECVKYAIEKGAKPTPNSLYIASKWCTDDIMRRLIDMGAAWSSWAINNLIRRENKEMLELALKSTKVAPNACVFAIDSGSLEWFKYIHELGGGWEEGETVCAIAATNGYLDCLKYAREHGCPWNESVCICAARAGHVGILVYAHNNGCPLTICAAYTARKHDIICYEYIMERVSFTKEDVETHWPCYTCSDTGVNLY